MPWHQRRVAIVSGKSGSGQIAGGGVESSARQALPFSVPLFPEHSDTSMSESSDPRGPRERRPSEPAPSGGYHRFRIFAHHVSHHVGAPWAFAVALLVVILWAVSGPVFHY